MLWFLYAVRTVKKGNGSTVLQEMASQFIGHVTAIQKNIGAWICFPLICWLLHLHFIEI